MRTEPRTLVRVGVAARKLGLHPITVRRWIKAGKIKAVQIGREARIPMTEIERLLGEQPSAAVALYGRVSGHDQRKDLEAQLTALKAWAEQQRPGRETILLSDIGSGLKADRKNLQKLLALVQERQVSEIAVTYADRLTRFGLEYLTTFFSAYGVRLTVLHPEEEKTPERELTDDLIAIITLFSGRLYGMRSRKQKELLKCTKEVLGKP